MPRLPARRLVQLRRLRLALGDDDASAVDDGVRVRRPAGHRALLVEQPYTKLSVTPGDTQVELGKNITVGIEVTGRTSRQVTLFTRNSGDPAADWQEQKVMDDDLKGSDTAVVRYEVDLVKIKEPLAYRVIAGKVASEEYQIGVQYPLHLDKVEVVVADVAEHRRS
jgi:hypothetical protein